MKELSDRKLSAIFWDMPAEAKNKLVDTIRLDPMSILRNEAVSIRILESLDWYELIGLIGALNLYNLLDDSTLERLFPPSRRTYYSNAKRLLSKYIISPAG